MSRIGKKPIQVQDEVKVTIENGTVIVNGPKGMLQAKIPSGITVSIQDGKIVVNKVQDDLLTRSYYGLIRTIIDNMVTGVTNGFEKKLEIQGVGYRAVMAGSNLVLSVGHSHPVNIEAPDGISFAVEKNIIKVNGIDKVLVGQIAAKIRSVRPPEPYKGKGIRYFGEYVQRKAGKTAKA